MGAPVFAWDNILALLTISTFLLLVYLPITAIPPLPLHVLLLVILSLPHLSLPILVMLSIVNSRYLLLLFVSIPIGNLFFVLVPHYAFSFPLYNPPSRSRRSIVLSEARLYLFPIPPIAHMGPPYTPRLWCIACAACARKSALYLPMVVGKYMRRPMYSHRTLPEYINPLSAYGTHSPKRLSPNDPV